MKHEASIDENFRSLVVGEQKVVDVAIENGNIVYTWSPQWDAWNDLQHSKEPRLPKDRAAPVLSKGKKDRFQISRFQLNTASAMQETFAQLEPNSRLANL